MKNSRKAQYFIRLSSWSIFGRASSGLVSCFKFRKVEVGRRWILMRRKIERDEIERGSFMRRNGGKQLKSQKPQNPTGKTWRSYKRRQTCKINPFTLSQTPANINSPLGTCTCKSAEEDDHRASNGITTHQQSGTTTWQHAFALSRYVLIGRLMNFLSLTFKMLILYLLYIHISKISPNLGFQPLFHLKSSLDQV